MNVIEKYGTEVEIIKFDLDWLQIKNLCRGTIGMQDSRLEPTDDWKQKLLLAEHSPLRHSLITIEIRNIPYALSTHFVRHHEGVTPYVRTSRSDRTGIDRSQRSQMDVVDMRLDLNIQSIINISRKRLCNQADAETRQIWQMVVDKLSYYDKNLAWACVPEGIHVGSCPESFGDCTSCVKFLQNLSKEELLDLRQRITLYQEKNSKRIKLTK